MITEDEYTAAIAAKNAAEATITQYHSEKVGAFEERLRTNPVFKDEELIYAAYILCPCGHGMAYPRGCGPLHYWDCSAILRGIADKEVEHAGQQPFTMTNIKSEQQASAHGATTRGVFRPKPAA